MFQVEWILRLVFNLLNAERLNAQYARPCGVNFTIIKRFIIKSDKKEHKCCKYSLFVMKMCVGRLGFRYFSFLSI
jgi:hypothetical protein